MQALLAPLALLIERIAGYPAPLFKAIGHPVTWIGALIDRLDRRLNTGRFMDLGMFIENILIAARAQGLHTCAQAAFAWFHKVARTQLPIGDHEILACGIALGHEDLSAPENAFITERAEVDAFASFHGF